jgi:predicted DNA-binding protein
MPVSVRLDSETEELLKKASRALGASKSAVVKQSIKHFCAPLAEIDKSDLSGTIKALIRDHPGSGKGDLAIRSKEILRERLGKKR